MLPWPGFLRNVRAALQDRRARKASETLARVLDRRAVSLRPCGHVNEATDEWCPDCERLNTPQEQDP